MLQRLRLDNTIVAKVETQDIMAEVQTGMIMAEAIGVVTVAMVAAPMVAVEGPTMVERTLVMTFMKGCVKKLQTSDKTREPYKKMHGDN